MKVDFFYNRLLGCGFGPFTGVPCSIFKDLINYIEKSSESKYYTVASEGEAMGLAGGFALSSKFPVVLMQSDGYGNTVNPLSSLQLLYKLPVLLIISWRGMPGIHDAPQHMIMGETIRGLLDVFKIPYKVLEDNHIDLEKSSEWAKDYTSHENKPCALLVKKGYFEKTSVKEDSGYKDQPKRMDYFNILSKEIDEEDIVLATTGYTGREVIRMFKHPAIFYTAGSMGCVSSIGLGIALENPHRKVYVLDGDGSLLMKLGTLTTIGRYAPKNLIHIVFDNGVYESTGGQSTCSSTSDLRQIALSANYKNSYDVGSLKEFKSFLTQAAELDGPTFFRVYVSQGTLENLERPSESSEWHKKKFQEYLISEK